MIWFLERTQCIDDGAKFEGKHEPQRQRKYADPQKLPAGMLLVAFFWKHRDSVKCDTNNGQFFLENMAVAVFLRMYTSNLEVWTQSQDGQKPECFCKLEKNVTKNTH